MPRERSIGIRLTEDDRARLGLEAEMRGLSVSGYIRSRLLAGPDDQANHEAIQKLTTDIEQFSGIVGSLQRVIENLDTRLRRLEALAEGSDY